MRLQIIISIGAVTAIALASSVFVTEAESLEAAVMLNPSHDCSFCHASHGSPGPSLTVGTDVEVLCLTCHGAAGTSTLKADVHQNARRSDYAPIITTCTTCHDPHDGIINWLGGTNIKLVGIYADGSGLARILTPNNGIQNVVFESRGTNVGDPFMHSFADDDEDDNDIWDGICEVCHTETDNHQNTSSGNHSHNTGKTCTNCHDHFDGFLR